MGEYQAAAPCPCPDRFKPEVDKLHKDAALIMDSFSVPYSVQAAMASDGYVRLSDLADRYSDSKEARTDAPKELGFAPGTNNFDDKSSKFVAMRLAQAIDRAKSSSSTLWQSPSKGATGPFNNIGALSPSNLTELGPGVRDTLQELWKQRTGDRPPELSEQGSDAFILAFMKLASKGEIGYFPQKHITSKLPDPEDIVPQDKRYKLESGLLIQDNLDYMASVPHSFQKWQVQNRVFRNTLLMATWSHSTFSQFDLSLTEAREFYDFLEGPEVATRRPPPSLSVVMVAERKAWREIALKMHGGLTLSQAVKKQMESFLFWQREVYEYISQGPSNSSSSYMEDAAPRRGKGAYSNKRQRTLSRKGDRGAKGPGKGNAPKGKGLKGKFGKGKSSQTDPPTKSLQKWPSTWANKDLRGTELCRRYHMGAGCNGDCSTGRSHLCPVLTKTGQQCNQRHRGVNCRHHS